MAKVSGTFAGYGLDEDGASFSLTCGVSPSRGKAVLAVESLIAVESGDLVLAHGGDSVNLSNLKVEGYRVVKDERGTRLEISLVDRRWEWAFGSITGAYNRQNDDGTQPRDKSMRELAALCLDAMGEPLYDVSVLPTDCYPFVAWEFATPAAALDELLGNRYCVALGVDGLVRICRRGSGATPPTGKCGLVSFGRAATPRPGSYMVRGGRIVREVTVADLVPVGEEADGSIVPVEELSYAPVPGTSDGGWGEEALCAFRNVSDETCRALAEKCVFKWYALPDGSPLPILDERVGTGAARGSAVRLLPEVSGREDVWDGQTYQRDAQKKVKSGYTVDRRLGIVKFRRMVTRAEGSDQGATKLAAAELELTYAYELDSGTKEDYYVYTEEYDGGSKALVIHRPELILYQIDPGSGPVDRNRDELDSIASELLGAYRETSEYAASESMTYNTIMNVSPDGAIERVSWSISAAGGAATSVERNPARMAHAGHISVQTDLRDALLKKALAEARGDTELSGKEGEIHGEYRLCKNVSGYDIPANSLVEAVGWDASDNLIKVSRPSSAKAAAVLLVPNEIKNGAIGKCYETGTHGVTFDATYPSNPASDPVAIGNRLGSQANSFRARKSPAGNQLVKAVIRSATVSDPTGLALVQFVGNVGVRVVKITYATDKANGNYKVKEWGFSSGVVGPEFDAKGVANGLNLDEIVFAVLDADGFWILTMTPYAVYG